MNKKNLVNTCSSPDTNTAAISYVMSNSNLKCLFIYLFVRH